MMDRRRFLTILGGTVTMMSALDWCPAGAQGASAELAGPSTQVKGYSFFTQPEVDFIQAAIARLIPADELGPGALEADVGFFLDRQLSGAYGNGGRAYFFGPYGEESEFQGYQLPLVPRELYRAGIAATDRYCEETYGKPFAQLEPGQQDEVLQGLQGVANDIDLRDVPGATFFGILLRNTKEGFFSDPILGGNKDKVGWKLIGFPGAAAVYTDVIFRANEPYEVEPVGITDMQHAGIPGHHHGYVVHASARPGDVVRTTAPSGPKGRLEVAEDTVWPADIIV